MAFINDDFHLTLTLNCTDGVSEIFITYFITFFFFFFFKEMNKIKFCVQLMLKNTKKT